MGREVGSEALASSTQHHQGDGPTSLHGPVSTSTAQRAMCSGGLVIEAVKQGKGIRIAQYLPHYAGLAFELCLGLGIWRLGGQRVVV